MRPIILNNWFFWNLDQSVGKSASNGDPTDVSLAQWFYTQLAAHPAGVPPDHMPIYRAVQVSGGCTGRDDDPLVAAILTTQKVSNAGKPTYTVDGHISVVHGGVFYAPTTPFLILQMSTTLAGWHPNVYPRLDLIPGCPPNVANAVRKAIPHS